MIKRSLKGICVILIVFIAHTGFAADAPQELLVVRRNGFWPPREMVIDGELTGLHIELVREVAHTLNLSVTFKSYPWKRAIYMLKAGKADAITFMSKTEEREQFGYFLKGNVISKSQVGFVILRTHEDAIHFSGDLKSMQKYTIGTCRGFSYNEEFDKATYLKKDIGASNEERLLKKLLAERFLVALGDTTIFKYHAKHMGVTEKLVYLRPYLLDRFAQYVVFSKAKSNDALAKLFADAMEEFKSTLQYHELLNKYGLGEDQATP